ncbi:MAG: ATP phosphoribosyltransferase regulatory subunit [Acidaminococcales bacterium]|jgi:ATP phosphoribosyltransferase regulatory subunit|nr:ATP phosphoribosyltransferase regulatory subunit [Acidaminococcales bacterium]
MIKNNFVWQIPYGVKDFLIGEAARKRALESGAAELFARWGYQEVVTPTFEYLETFDSSTLSEQAFKFFDREGRALILRPDMTCPIARLVSARMRDADGPRRLFYIANVFRYEQAQAGRQCEFYQAGVELLGAPCAAADAEIVALAVETLKNAGLDNFKINMGHVDFLNGVVESASLDPRDGERIRSLLAGRDLAGLEAFAAERALPPALRECLREAPLLHGGKEALEKAYRLAGNPTSARALDNLKNIFAMLESYGAAGAIDFDLGLIRDFGYYTGMVFEGYTPGLGFPICGGGRYDNMMRFFGESCPAIGFSAGVDRLLIALGRRNAAVPSAPGAYVAWREGFFGRAVAAADNLRAQGRRAELAFCAQTADEALESARGRDLVYIEK